MFFLLHLSLVFFSYLLFVCYFVLTFPHDNCVFSFVCFLWHSYVSVVSFVYIVSFDLVFLLFLHYNLLTTLFFWVYTRENGERIVTSVIKSLIALCDWFERVWCLFFVYCFTYSNLFYSSLKKRCIALCDLFERVWVYSIDCVFNRVWVYLLFVLFYFISSNLFSFLCKATCLLC